MAADTTRLRRLFREVFEREPELIAEAPGRVNLIGEHTDYNEGFVLPVAIDRTVAVAVAIREDRRIGAYSVDPGGVDEAEMPPTFLASGGWRNYVRGVTYEIVRAHPEIGGADFAIDGDVPQGAGLSSSAALEVAVAGAMAAANDLHIDPREVAFMSHAAENEFVGVQCGIMDQFAAALSEAGHALLIDCRLREATTIPMPDDVSIVVVNSGVSRNLANTEYNRRRSECAEAADFLDVDSLRDVPEERLPDVASELDEHLFRRVRHVVTEDGRVLAAADALRHGNVAELGRLLYRSHESLRDDFEVSIPELDRLVDIAREVDGVYGARLTGAGFGGCIVALMRPDAVAGFEDSISNGYRTPDGRLADVWVCKAADGLRVTHV